MSVIEKESPQAGNSIVALAFKNPSRVPPLSDPEVVYLRKMMATYKRICEDCPMAKHYTKGKS